MHREFTAAQLLLPNNSHRPWYQHVDLSAKSQQKIRSITHRRNRTGQMIPRNPPPSPNDVVANLTCGFWKHLVDVLKYSDNSQVPINNILSLAFPHYPNSSPALWARQKWKDKLFSRLDLISDVRNRVAHLEPIWKFGELLEETRPRLNKVQSVVQSAPNTPIESINRLTLVVNRTIELLHWISPARARDFNDSVNNKKLKYLLTQSAIADFKMCQGNRAINLFGLYRIISGKKNRRRYFTF